MAVVEDPGKSAATKTGSCCGDKEGAQKTINK